MLSNSNNNKDEQEFEANLWRLMRSHRKEYKEILDQKYVILRTIGDGRYAKVKLAVDLKSHKQVAIKILKVKQQMSKRIALECMFKEVKILSQCDHPNIAKILEASVDGLIVKEKVSSTSETLEQSSRDNEDLKEVEVNCKRKGKVCYYVMKLAEYGELFRFIEHTDRFSEKFARSLFWQLINGVNYLHLNGIVHRDLKPENLLIDSKFRLVIGDFGFAQKSESNADNPYSSIVDRSRLVGSEEYNPPELNSDMSNHNFDQHFEEQLKLEDELYSKDKRNAENLIQYDGVKADIFSSAATLFLMVMRCAPFRKAHIKDPYFKRLSAQDKKPFWNIFKGIPSSGEFKDLFEMASRKNPSERPTLENIAKHKWMEFEKLGDKEFKEEVLRRYETIEKMGQLDFDQLNSNKAFEHAVDEELDQKDMHEFEQLRRELIEETLMLNKKIKHKYDLKKIKKEALKNMVEGPPILASMICISDQKMGKSPAKEAANKNYHSDPETRTRVRRQSNDRRYDREDEDSQEEE